MYHCTNKFVFSLVSRLPHVQSNGDDDGDEKNYIRWKLFTLYALYTFLVHMAMVVDSVAHFLSRLPSASIKAHYINKLPLL